jgi:hypothetical protein
VLHEKHTELKTENVFDEFLKMRTYALRAYLLNNRTEIILFGFGFSEKRRTRPILRFRY